MSVKYDITSAFLTKSGYRTIHAGDDYDHAFEVCRAGSPLNLTAAKLWFTVKERSSDPDSSAKLQYDSSDSTEIEITSPTAGAFIIHLKAADTEDLEGTWKYDIKAKLNTTRPIFRIARGVIEFLPNITEAST